MHNLVCCVYVHVGKGEPGNNSAETSNFILCTWIFYYPSTRPCRCVCLCQS